MQKIRFWLSKFNFFFHIVNWLIYQKIEKQNRYFTNGFSLNFLKS